MEIWIPPSNSPVGRSKLQTGRWQVLRWLKSREDAPPLPFLALSIVRELFCIVSNLTHLALCFFKFCLGRDVWEQQLHSREGIDAAFHGGTITDCSTEAATEVDGHTQSPTVASETWLRSGRSSPAWNPFGMILAPEGKGMEQAVSLGVSWGQLYVLGSNGRQNVY